jgi:hypothetical protein
MPARWRRKEMAVLTVRAGALWNPALPSQNSFALFVSVVDAFGRPVEGLAKGAFAVAVYDRYLGPGQPATPTIISDFGESQGPPAGVYGMGVAPAKGNYGDPEAVVVIDVASGADAGRGVLNLVW